MKTTRLTLVAALFAGSVAFTQAAEVTPLWDKHCASCHGKDGVGNTRMGKQSGVKDYTDPKVQAEMKDDVALASVKNGITEKGKDRMKPFKDKLSDDEIKALIAHMRTFKK
ncbi:MAG: cytochrome c [Verrucomicrobiota bacterium]